MSYQQQQQPQHSQPSVAVCFSDPNLQPSPSGGGYHSSPYPSSTASESHSPLSPSSSYWNSGAIVMQDYPMPNHYGTMTQGHVASHSAPPSGSPYPSPAIPTINVAENLPFQTFFVSASQVASPTHSPNPSHSSSPISSPNPNHPAGPGTEALVARPQKSPGMSNVPAGQVTVSYSPNLLVNGAMTQPAAVNLATPSRSSTPNQYSIHHNKLVAGLTVNTENGALRAYTTYEVQIHFVAEVFGSEYQQWNQNYDAAIKIFSDRPSSALIRTAIRAAHAELYRKGLFRSQQGVLHNGKEFLELIHLGLRDGIPRFYTYVLLDDRLYFSETGASFFRDFMSKRKHLTE